MFTEIKQYGLIRHKLEEDFNNHHKLLGKHVLSSVVRSCCNVLLLLTNY